MRYIYILALVGFCGPQLVACRKNSKVSWLYGAVKIATVISFPLDLPDIVLVWRLKSVLDFDRSRPSCSPSYFQNRL